MAGQDIVRRNRPGTKRKVTIKVFKDVPCVYEIVQDMYSWPNQDFSEMESTLSVQQVSDFTL